MDYFYTYKITFIDGDYYYGSRQASVTPEEDIYWGSPKTHKDKWKTTMFFKTILKVFDVAVDCSNEEVDLIRPVYRTDPHCLNENCSGRINMSPEVRKRMSEAKKGKPSPKKGKPMSEAQRKKLSEVHKGNRPSIETRQRMSEAHKGKPRTPHTEETKQKIREKRALQVCSEETKKKMSQSIKDKIWITNGIESHRINKDDFIPEGYRKGRVIRTPKDS